jgi:hypothetical protein
VSATGSVWVLLGFCIGLPGASVGCADAHEAASTDEQVVPAIRLHIYNYARVPRPILVTAERDLVKIFRRSGVTAESIDCSLSASEMATPGCEERSGASDLILKLLPSSMAHGIAGTEDTFGIAITVQDQPATDAFVFYQRVTELARTGYIRKQEALAAVMAHEIGHLLLGPSHSSEGIMRARWSRDELQLARMGLLLFTPHQSALIRAEARARLHARRLSRGTGRKQIGV